MAKSLFTIQSLEGDLTLEKLKKWLNLKEDDLDHKFGLIVIDPEIQLYTFRAEEKSIKKVDVANKYKLQGPFSDPKVGSTRGPGSDE
jgi:hypothetical protein